MKIILESEHGRRFEAEFEDLEEYYQVIRDGLVAMSYHQETVNKWFPQED